MGKRRFPTWVIAAIIVVIGFGFYWQATEPARLVGIGEDIFAETCSECHGKNGQGKVNDLMATALNEDGHAWYHPDAQLRGFIRNGTGNMPAFGGTFSNREIEGLVEYIKTLWPEDKLEIHENLGTSPAEHP